MRTLIGVQKLDGSGGIAKDVGELAALLGCELHHLIGPLKMDHWFRYHFEPLDHLDAEETAARFRYRVEYVSGSVVGVVMIERELWA